MAFHMSSGKDNLENKGQALTAPGFADPSVELALELRTQ